MNVIDALDWLAVFAFIAGALAGVGVGWLFRGWRDADAAAEVAERRAKVAANATAKRARPTDRSPVTTRPARTSAETAPHALLDGSADAPMILLIDDRVEMLGIHAAYLRKHGYRTLMAENGETGLYFARAYHPTLIVLDHSMPDRTGVEVARELKADPVTADIPILLMTALSYGAIGSAAIEAGCAAFLPKPIEPSRLLREIEAHTPKPKH